jgi:putative membrane protein insertion efficiency factor
MGHRDTPEEFGGARGVCGADGGFAAGVEGFHVDKQVSERDPALGTAGEDRLKSVLPGAGVRVALFALRFYKAYLSILFAGNCRFEPTCSRYAYEAIERFGVVRGVWLGTKRLLRCQPLSRRFGFDPVPEKWEIMSSETKAVETPASRAAATQNEVHS